MAFPQRFQVAAGPFVGVNDAKDLDAQVPERAASITNGYIPSQPGGGCVVSRPGIGRGAVERTIYTNNSYVATSTFGLTGTLSFTNGDATVTGIGTDFLSELRVGMYVKDDADGTYYLVSAINGVDSLDISVTTAATGTGSTASASSTGANTAVFVYDADSIAVGDAITVYSTTKVITARTDANHFTASSAWSSGTYNTTYTVAGGAATGPLYDPFLYINTSGATKKLVFAKTTNTAVAGGGAGIYRFLDGSSVRYRLLEYDPTATYLNFVDRTSASMDGIAIDTANRLYTTNFNNYWILVDGTNRPRKVNSSYVLSNLTDLTVATYARPTVYYGKLFFILDSDKATLVWSEENDPDTGYTNTSYNDSWTLRQTSPDTLEAIEGTNTALYVWRTNSTTMITGAVTSDFASAGTQDGLSTTIGTRSPDAVVTVGETVFFLDQYCRPHVIEPGRGVVPLYDNCQATLGTPPTSAAQLRKAWGRLVSSVNGNPIVVWCFPATEAATTQSTLLAFDAYTREFLGTWTHPSTPNVTYGTLWRDTNNAPVLAMCSGTAADLACYVQRSDVDASVGYDVKSDGNAVRVALTVETPKMVPDTKGAIVSDVLWTRCDMGGRDINATEATLSIETRTSRSSAYGTGITFTSAAVTTDFPDKYSVGLNKNGRWWQARVSNDTSTGGRTAVGPFVVEGYVRRDDPHIK